MVASAFIPVQTLTPYMKDKWLLRIFFTFVHRWHPAEQFIVFDNGLLVPLVHISTFLLYPIYVYIRMMNKFF